MNDSRHHLGDANSGCGGGYSAAYSETFDRIEGHFPVAPPSHSCIEIQATVPDSVNIAFDALFLLDGVGGDVNKEITE